MEEAAEKRKKRGAGRTGIISNQDKRTRTVENYRPCPFGVAHNFTTIPKVSPARKKFVLQAIGGERGIRSISNPLRFK